MENDATVEAARTALVAIGWDGEDPRPVGGLIFALADELELAGHSRRNVAIMMEKIGRFLTTL